MKYDSQKHHRRSIRLQGYDYAQAGAYYITIAAQGRACLFGEVVGEMVQLNAAGQMIEKWWLELAHKFPAVSLGAHMVMPNHFHGVIIINDVGADLCVGPGASKDKGAHVEDQGAHVGAPLRIGPVVPGNTDVSMDKDARENNQGAHMEDRGAHVGAPLPEVVQWFKTMTTNEYIRGVKQLGWAAFDGKLWQRNYYEHVIRNDDDYNRIHNYIENNPANWTIDDENTAKPT